MHPRCCVAVVIFTVATVAGTACTKKIENTGWKRDNLISVDSQSRSYDLFVPATATTPHPVLFLLHGNGGSAAQLMGVDGKVAPFKLWQDVATRENIILVVPNGQEEGWNDCRADSTTNPTTDDVAFITTLLDAVAAQRPIDAQRVYVAGMSNGGHMALRLALESPQRFAAVAAVAGGMPATSECTSQNTPISVLLMNGTDDPICPYDGGAVGIRKENGERGTVTSIDAAVSSFVSANVANVDATVVSFPAADSGSSVTRMQHCCGQQSTEVVLYRIDGGGHTEPSQKERYGAIFRQVVGTQNADIEAVDEMWAFFKDKRRL
jgi:polyhydroxybutyrate depolymerase